jgi:hypothetical protein
VALREVAPIPLSSRHRLATTHRDRLRTASRSPPASGLRGALGLPGRGQAPASGWSSRCGRRGARAARSGRHSVASRGRGPGDRSATDGFTGRAGSPAPSLAVVGVVAVAVAGEIGEFLGSRDATGEPALPPAGRGRADTTGSRGLTETTALRGPRRVSRRRHGASSRAGRGTGAQSHDSRERHSRRSLSVLRSAESGQTKRLCARREKPQTTRVIRQHRTASHLVASRAPTRLESSGFHPGWLSRGVFVLETTVSPA